MAAPELIAFVGPSLARAEADALLRGAARPQGGRALAFRLEPPAKQGDIWRALARRPRALALIDGLFESAPSVWHHELLDALDAGVLVFGAASMGALRASELKERGMIGVGAIYARYRDGLDDDAAVALLHAGADDGFAPLTVPLVNAEHAIAAAARAGALSAAEEKRMQRAAASLHYQERRWPEIAALARLSPDARARWERFAAAGLPDLKADDARACLREAAAAALARRQSGNRPAARLRSPPASARVRATRAAWLAAQSPLPTAAEQRDAERLLFVAAAARAVGLAPDAAALDAAEARLFAGAGPEAREARMLRQGLAEDEKRALVEALALESLALAEAARILPDGPSSIEATRTAQLLRALSR